MVVDDKDQTMIIRQYRKVDDLGFSHAVPVDKEIKKSQ
jgi:glycyl-tRNA synthetase (class II)